MGLKNDDTEWRHTLRDAHAAGACDKKLLDMMYYILLNCAPELPKDLFNEFAHLMGMRHRDVLLRAGWEPTDART